MQTWATPAAKHATRAQSTQLPPMTYDHATRVQTNRPAGGRLARVRRRVDGVLTGMLSDDSDGTTPAPPTWPGEAAAEHSPAQAARPDLAARQLMATPVPTDAETLTAAGAEALTSGYRSKHRLDAPAKSAAPQGPRRTGPRHAAPPPGLGATLSRRLTSPRLTSRTAAHAGG